MLAHRVSRPLVPAHRVVGLLRGENFDKAAAVRVKAVRPANVAMQADRVELRQHIHPVDAAVDAVRERDIDQAVLARQRHSRLRAVFGQRIKPRPASAAENQGQGIFH